MKPNSLEAALARPKLAVHDYSRTIFKLKPKIRIIHIVEPEIINTKVEDFQELVQRLTGNPADQRKDKGNKASSPMLQPKKPYISKPVIKTEPEGIPVLQETPRMKIEVEETSFSSFLEEVDGFFQDMNEFPQLCFKSSHFNMFGEMPLC